jgi:predicted RNA-binding Zn-ribbon protein involved in translation (DUF1610 family)
VLAGLVLGNAPHRGSEIREYVEWQAPDEKVLHLEKVATEHLLDRKLDVWDVQTNGDRYWVITNPTNLYSHELFPSMDYTLSFHIGVTTRILARRENTIDDSQQKRFGVAWRKWLQAANAFDRADEAEEFQAIGMRCREALLSLIRSTANDAFVPAGAVRPKLGDFIHWSELIADSAAAGSSAREIRGYLKDITRATWQFVNWLTHAAEATPFDAHIAIDATQNTLSTMARVILRFERGAPTRCPECSSYRITSTTLAQSRRSREVLVCESCGWVERAGRRKKQAPES